MPSRMSVAVNLLRLCPVFTSGTCFETSVWFYQFRHMVPNSRDIWNRKHTLALFIMKNKYWHFKVNFQLSFVERCMLSVFNFKNLSQCNIISRKSLICGLTFKRQTQTQSGSGILDSQVSIPTVALSIERISYLLLPVFHSLLSCSPRTQFKNICLTHSVEVGFLELSSFSFFL